MATEILEQVRAWAKPLFDAEEGLDTLNWSVSVAILPDPTRPANFLSVTVVTAETPSLLPEGRWHSVTSVMPPGVDLKRVEDSVPKMCQALRSAVSQELASGTPREATASLSGYGQ